MYADCLKFLCFINRFPLQIDEAHKNVIKIQLRIVYSFHEFSMFAPGMFPMELMSVIRQQYDFLTIAHPLTAKSAKFMIRMRYWTT